MFVDNLMTAAESQKAGGATIIIALRADFYNQCFAYDSLRGMLEQHQRTVGRMTNEELRSAIEQPALHKGWSFEPGLVEIILAEVGHDPSALPLRGHEFGRGHDHEVNAVR